MSYYCQELVDIMRKYSVKAVVVAYNSPKELEACINGIVNQSYPVSKIIIVDNSSDECAKKNKELIESYLVSTFYYIQTGENIGSAGGFSIGTKHAVDEECDFVWLNDQDGIPDTNCLYCLLSAFESNNENIGLYAPKVIDMQDGYELKSFRQAINVFGNVMDLPDTTSNTQFFDIAGTTGILLYSKMIKKIGTYNSKVFFVGNEDIEYSMRIIQAGYKCLLVNDALYQHPDLIKKYNISKKTIAKIPIPYKIKPMNLGLDSDGTYRTKKNCIGKAYINALYVSNPFQVINLCYSLIRLLICKLSHSSVRVNQTINEYREGIALAKIDKDKIKSLYKKSD